MKIQKKNWGGGDRGSGWGGGGVKGGCEWRSEAFVKIKKYIYFFFFWGGGGDRVRGSDLGGGGGVRVDGNGELKLL